MKTKTNKRIAIAVLTTLGLIIAVVIGGSFYMLDYSLCPENNSGRNVSFMYDSLYRDYPYIKPWLDSLRSINALRDTMITTENGEHQHALYIRARKKSNLVAVLVHGYISSSVKMLPKAKIYTDMGFNVLLPDLHGNGQSDGYFQQMGWKDRLDVMNWMEIANRMFKDSAGNTLMVVHGVSMGAATVMMVSGEKLPYYVKCFVEDCGYTSVWDEFKYQLGEQFGLPAFPLMYSTSLLCEIKCGWNFKEASALKAVSRCHKPMLFIHGDNDDFVPTNMVYSLYKAKPQPKSLWIAHGAGHNESLLMYPDEYTGKVREFVCNIIE